MNFKGLIASILSLLVTAATFAFAASAATTLDQYPGFLWTGGQLNAYVVIGSGGTDPAGLASDVSGAVDLAVRLAELQYTKTTVAATGGTTVAGFSGLERDIQVQSPVTVNASSSGFPASLQSYHFSTLKRGTVTFNGQTYNYHEEVDVGNGVVVEHNSSVTNVNGTETLVVPSGGFAAGGISYRFVFDQAISGLGSTTTPNYTYTLTVPLAGQNIIVTGVDSTGFTALAGNVGIADSKTPIAGSGGYNVYVTDGSSGSWAKIQIKDSSGNVVQTDVLNLNQQNTYTLGGNTFQVRVINVYASTVTNTASAQIAVGTNVAVTYPAAENVNSNYQVGSSPWYIHGTNGGFSTGTINSGNYISVSFDSQNTSYFKSGTYLTGPNSYFTFGLGGQLPMNWATITVNALSSGQTVYNSTSTTSYSSASGLSGFKIHSDTAGTIFPANANTTACIVSAGCTNGVDPLGAYSTSGWQDAYVLYSSSGATNATGAVYLGHYDTASSRIVYDLNFSIWPTYATSFPASFQLKYGGSGTEVYVLNISVSNSTTAAVAAPGTTLYASGTQTQTNGVVGTNVTWNWQQDSGVTWSSTVVPTFHLGTNKATADANDVTLGYEGNYNVGTFSQNLLTDGQVIVVAPSSNAAADQAVFQIPADLFKDRYLFGSWSGTTTTTTTSGATYYTFNGPIVSPVAILDSQISASQLVASNKVIVGGPCVNSVAATFLNVTYPSCGAASTIPTNAAIIQVKSGVFGSGANSLLVAGWSAQYTKLAADVLQNYDQASVSGKLVGKSMVTVSGTSVATATIQ